MATEVDHDAIKTTIVAILQSSATLYDVDDDSKLMAITVGRPNLEGVPNILPGAYVTNSPVLETIRSGPIVSNAHKRLEHSIRYLIVIGASGPDSATTESQLDDFQKLALQLLDADVQLKNGGSPAVDMSAPERVDSTVIKNAGQVVQLRQITLKCIKSTD